MRQRKSLVDYILFTITAFVVAAAILVLIAAVLHSVFDLFKVSN